MAIEDLIAQAEATGTPLDEIGGDEAEDQGTPEAPDDESQTSDDEPEGDDAPEEGEDDLIEDDAPEDSEENSGNDPLAAKTTEQLRDMYQNSQREIGRLKDELGQFRKEAQEERIATLIGLEQDGADLMDVARGVPIAEKVQPRAQQVYASLWQQEVYRRANESGASAEEVHREMLADAGVQQTLSSQAMMQAQQEFAERSITSMARTFARINGMPVVQRLVSNVLTKHGIKAHADKVAALADPLVVDQMQAEGRGAELEQMIVTIGKSIAYDEAVARREQKKGRPETAPTPRDGTRTAAPSGGGETAAPRAVAQRAREIAARGGVAKFLDKNELRDAAERELRAEGKL